jgi:serine/threonine protein kinase/Tol biopolymer transport system component
MQVESHSRLVGKWVLGVAMTSEQFQRVKELFAALEPLSAQERQRALEATSGNDSVVRAEVEKLLERKNDVRGSLGNVAEQIDNTLATVRVDASAMKGLRVGPYQVVEILGQGGMGIVYLAEDTRLARKAALKAILPGAEHNAMSLERLQREARILASLSHPNLATVYGLEESQGTLLLAMEYIEGKSLSQRLGRSSMPISEALHCCEQIAAGLEAAHAEGVIHRDLKPGNVMFTGEGVVKVLDFGLARELREKPLSSDGDAQLLTLTREGSVVGTPAYMSPEQARGESLDHRTDIFSFGSILFRCLAGRPAFEGETVTEVIDAIVTNEPDWSKLPARLPASVVSILKRCLAKNAADRYRHIGDVRLDLREAQVTRAWERRDPAPTPNALIRRWAPWVLALLSLAFAATAFWQRPRSPGTGVALAQRFDVAFPADAVQSDLERVQVALSPDGRRMVLACKTEEGQALWMRSHGDGQWRRIEHTEGGHRPFFSSDGQWITFFRAGHLYKRRPTASGDPIHLAALTNWYGASWADDGSLIYSAAWGNPLQKLSASDSKPQACTRLDTNHNARSHLSPWVISGGPWVLYSVWSGGDQTDIHATSLDGGQQHVVVVNASSPRVAATPRGDYLLFERASTIFAAPFDRRNAKVTASESAIAEGVMNDGTRFAAYFDVSGDGTLVYFPGTSFAEESRLAYVNSDGGTTPFNDDRMSFCEPVFSPVARKMAVLVKGKIYRSLVYDLARQTREFILTGGDTLSLAISPDGQKFSCTVNRDGGYGIDLISLVDGRRLGRIVQPGTDYQTDLGWSADGRLLAFSMSPREGTPNDIWLVEPLAEAHPRALVSSPGADTKPALSPDGQWIAYQSDVSGRAEVYLVTCPDGQTTRQVTFAGGASPAWSPNGKTLYFVVPQGLSSVSITSGGTVTSKATIVYDKPFGQSDPIARNYAIAPDGRPLIVEPSERRPTVSHLCVITNWYSLLP